MNSRGDSFTPAVVVVAWNRSGSLSRLLGSLDRAHYPDGVRLVISIDGGGAEEVIQVAEAFRWKAGEKEVLVRDERLGLKEHILACGRLATQFGSIIVLEDDLYVSPWFYGYAQEAVAFYHDDDRIAGVSLFAHHFNESAGFPFTPLEDDSDVFFLQLASSWGQAWTSDQWSSFEEWLSLGRDVRSMANVPDNVRSWPDASWKKHFIAYLVDSDRYFVYPRLSLTTNFSDPGGIHYATETDLLQVKLCLFDRSFRFKPIHESPVIYDAFCEIRPDTLRSLNPSLKDYDFEVDLYGTKSSGGLGRPFILTSRKEGVTVRTFGLRFKPIEANVIFDQPGSGLRLAAVNGEGKTHDRPLVRYHRLYDYFCGVPTVRALLRLLAAKVAKKVWRGR